MDSEPKNQLPLPVFCYRLAYFVLPQLLFAAPQRIIAHFNDASCPPALYFYVMGSVALETEVVVETGEQFQAHSGQLDAAHRYHVLQYPAPPPFDLAAESPVLAPFFSAIIERVGSENDVENAVRYYTLGQNPQHGTTLRSVLSEGANANLGAGPPPQLDAFLAALRARFE